MLEKRLTPTFSVITVTYNAEAVIEKTILSVLAQTYPQVEYIIVDGASTDKTLTIAGKYKERIATLVSEPDRGLYDAMNKGLQLATSDYVCFLNAGDTFHAANTLEQMVCSLSGLSQLPDVLYGETCLVDEQRRFLRMRRLSAPETLTWRSFKQGMLVCHQAFFAKRSLAPLYDLRYRFSSDFDWCVKVMQRATTLHNTCLILIDYLAEGMTTKNRMASLKERFRIMAKHYGLVSTLLYHLWFVVRLAISKVTL